MATLVTLEGPGRIGLEQMADEPLAAGQIRVRTIYSGISAGTELTAYRGSNPYLHKRWNAELRLFEADGAASHGYPLRDWGYEEVGEVVELGAQVTGPPPGTLVYGAWGHRSSAVLDAQYLRDRVLPPGLEPILGIFSHIGSVALNGVHDAAPRVGETVAVFGLGVLGQIVAQLLRAAGATVIGVDLDGERLRLAEELGSLDEGLNAADGAVAAEIKRRTGGRGTDVAIEASGQAAALNEAVRAAAYSSRVIAMGFYQGGAQSLMLGEEFHHNRIDLVCSQISGVAPELSRRWDRRRLAQTVMRLQADGVLRLRPLVSLVTPVARAAEAFRLLDAGGGQLMQVVLDFGSTGSARGAPERGAERR